MNKISSFFLAFLVCFGLTTPVFGTTYSITGTNVKSPTQEQIVQFYNKNQIDVARQADNRFSTNPYFDHPYTSGYLYDKNQDYAISSLNYIRYIAGLDYNVERNTEYVQFAQDSAFILAVLDGDLEQKEQGEEEEKASESSRLTHTPVRPTVWADPSYNSLYTSAYTGAGKSNIAAYNQHSGTDEEGNPIPTGNTRNLTNFLFYQWMAEFDKNDLEESTVNLTTVGHRRFILNPVMGYTGFGVAVNPDSYWTYSAMYAKDASNTSAANTTGVMWPAQNMPVDLFDSSYPWSFSTGSSISSSVIVTLTRLNDDEEWIFGPMDTDLNGKYLNVDNGNYGQPGCVIFRPDPATITYSQGDVFHVSITGGVEASYVVTFFALNEVTPSSGSLTPGNTPTSYTYADGTGSTVVTSIALNYSSLTLVQGDSRTVSAELTPSNATNKTIIWSTSNSSVAIVDSNGKVTGVSTGSCTLTATVGGISSSIPITVQQTNSEIPVERLTLTPTALEVPLGDGVRVSASIEPSNASNQTISWAISDTSIASVDSTGRVFGLSYGNTFLTATADGLSTTIPVKVSNITIIPITSIELSVGSLNLGVGQSDKVYVNILPANATNQVVNWQLSDDSIATIDSNGIVTALGVGGCYLTATVGDFSKSIPITVTALDGIIYPTHLTLNYASLSLASGESQVVSAIVYPSNTTNQIVTWSSSNSAVATVSSNGRITAHSSGTAYITAAVGAVSKSLEVQVGAVANEGAISNIVLNYSSFSLPVGGDDTLEATIYPATALTTSVTWSSSDPSIASISSTGVVTAHAVGTAELYATADGVTVMCTVTVHNYDTVVQVVGLSHKALTLSLWDYFTMYATVLPQDAVYPQVTWTSSHPSVVTVDGTGNLFAVSAGTAIITASTSNGVYGECEVTVEAPDYAARFQLIQDVVVEDWFYYYVKSVYQMGLMSGVSETEFAPDSIATRGMIAVILYALEGKPAMEPENIFTDVHYTSYYANAVNWAKHAGIVSGVTETLFAPEEPVTREQLATILYNYEIYSGNISAPSNSYLTFRDSGVISNWATNATSWCLDYNVMRGDTEGYFNPNDLATRAQFATVLVSLMNLS